MTCLLALVLVAAPAIPPGDLLQGKAPSASQGVLTPQQLTDGVFLREGESWDAPFSARIEPNGFARWDLGAPTEIRCLALQGDNNEDYIVDGSLDGENFTRIWAAEKQENAGLLTRYGQVQATARYLKVWTTGGDGLYAISEVAAWSTCPAPWPPLLERISGQPISPPARLVIAFFVLAMLLAISTVRPGATPLVKLTYLLPMAAGVYLVSWLIDPNFDAWGTLGLGLVVIAGYWYSQRPKSAAPAAPATPGGSPPPKAP